MHYAILYTWDGYRAIHVLLIIDQSMWDGSKAIHVRVWLYKISLGAGYTLEKFMHVRLVIK